MSSREEPPGYRPESESAPASGGHVTPDPSPYYDPLTAPVPPEREEAARREPITRDVIPGRTTMTRPVRRRPGMRRVRRTIRYIDPISVLKLSLFYYGIFLIVWLIIAAILFGILNSLGLFNAIEDISEGFALGWQVNIDLFFIEKWTFFIGLILVILGSLVNVLLAFLYNVGADMVGGIEVTFAERE